MAINSVAHVEVPFGRREGVAKVSASSGPDGALPIIFRIPVAAGAAANVDVTAKFKFTVIDAWAQHLGGAGEASDTLTIQNSTNAITDALDWSGADKAVVRAGTIDDAYATLDEGDTLRVAPSDSDAGDDLGAGMVFVLAVRTA